MSSESRRIFYRRVRHNQALNLSLIRHCCKSVKCIIAGDSTTPELRRLRELASSKSIRDLPLTFWEYELCIELIKVIRSSVLSKDFNRTIKFHSTALFGKKEPNLSPYEECLILIAENNGFDVTKEVSSYETIYQLYSIYD